MQNQITWEAAAKIIDTYLEKRQLQRCCDKNLNAAKLNICEPIMLTLHSKVGSENIIALFKYVIGRYVHNGWDIRLVSGDIKRMTKPSENKRPFGLVPYQENLSQASET